MNLGYKYTKVSVNKLTFTRDYSKILKVKEILEVAKWQKKLQLKNL